MTTKKADPNEPKRPIPQPGMFHLNGDLLCAVDTETTNLDPRKGEILEIAIVPLNNRLLPNTGIFPFHIKMRPSDMDAIDMESLAVTKVKLADIALYGTSQEEGADALRHWFDKLKLAYRKRIAPLGHNFANYDRDIIRKWLGHEEYDSIFHYHVRDTMQMALFLNDRCEWSGMRIPFPKVSLQYLCTTLKIKRDRSHTAIDDCLATAECFRRMMGTVTGPLAEVREEESPLTLRAEPATLDSTSEPIPTSMPVPSPASPSVDGASGIANPDSAPAG